MMPMGGSSSDFCSHLDANVNLWYFVVVEIYIGLPVVSPSVADLTFGGVIKKEENICCIILNSIGEEKTNRKIKIHRLKKRKLK